MENEQSLESGLSRPLLADQIQKSSRGCGEAVIGSVPRKPSNWKAPAIILGFSFLESVAFNGVGLNLVLYLQTVLHGSPASNAANAASWGGTSYLTPLLAGILADSVWGYYRTLVVSIILYLIGMVLIIFSALDSSLSSVKCEEFSSCPPASAIKSIVFFAGLYLVAFGSGGTRSSLLPLGADQFNDEIPIEKEKKWAFFSWFYLWAMLGVLVAGTSIVWVQQNINWALGFGIAALCIGLASASFLLGTPTYHTTMPTGSPLKSVAQVLVASVKKMHLKIPADGNVALYEENQEDSHYSGREQLVHTNEFRFLDKAAIISDTDMANGNIDVLDSWSLCTVTQIEELKILVRLIPIWFTSIIYTAACTQMNSTFILQGNVMNTRIGSFTIPPASLSSFGVISIMIWVFLYNYIISPACRNCTGNGKGLSQLQRIGIARAMMVVTMLTAGYIETSRLKSINAGKNLSIAWQLPQYFFVSGSEVFNYIPLLEFFYGEAPLSMRSICTSFALLSTALGNFLSSFIITLVALLSTRDGRAGWIPEDLNQGHLDYYYYTLAGLCALNFFIYLAFAVKYSLKKVR